jgi:CubicO group peptidase (beta-lactamase class C family)
MDNPISKFLSERIAAGDFPCAVYSVIENGRVIASDALGLAVRTPQEIPASRETMFDLASLTKVLVTGLIVAVLIDRG